MANIVSSPHRPVIFQQMHIERYTRSDYREVIYTDPENLTDFPNRISKAKKFTNYNCRIYRGNKWTQTWQYINNYLVHIYHSLIIVLLLDYWILKQFSGLRKYIGGKNKKLTCIIIAPLLFLNGCFCALYVSSFLSHAEIPSTIVEELSINEVNNKTEPSKNHELQKIDSLINIHNTVKKNNNLTEVETRSYDNSSIIMLIDKLTDKLDGLERTLSAMKDWRKKVDTVLEEYFADSISGKNISILMEQLKLILEAKDYTFTTAETIIAKKANFLSEERVIEIVKQLLKVYDADKTGRVDYAIETAGAEIVSTRHTQLYTIKLVYHILGFKFYRNTVNNNPQIVIKGNPIQPGTCWAFQGFPGYLLIKLRNLIYVTGFTMEHASKYILSKNDISSAPQKFDVWGLTEENDPEPVLFGKYEYADSDDSIQYFAINNANITIPYEYVELRIHSNHGKPDYTCLYRFRVHGTPV